MTSSMLSCLPSCVTDILKREGGGGGLADKLVYLKDLNPSEIANGLKEALTNGIDHSVKKASLEDGFNGNPLIRLPFPPAAESAASTLRSMGLGSMIDTFELQMNRGAELAASQAAPIFVDAIRQLEFDDVMKIMRGDKDAATSFLKRTTSTKLKVLYNPMVGQSLDRTMATKYYGEIVSKYNMIPLVKKVDPNLSEYVTGKAIDGLFVYVAEEEGRIREQPVARTTDLLKKIFGAIMDE